MSTFDFDLVVIGGGSGGLAAAKEATKVKPGLRVACFDFVVPTTHGTQWGLGGTCVNVGCIPKKLMHYAASLGHKQDDAVEYGWKNIGEKKQHDWSVMSKTILDYIRSLNWSYKLGLTGAKVKYFNALVKFLDPHTIQYTDKKGVANKMTAEHFIISVGGRPNTFTYPGKELCLTSDDLFWQKKNPGKTLVIGASYIALECAGFLRGIGNEVAVMVRSQVLRNFDQMCASQVAELLERKGVRFLKPAVCVSFEAQNKMSPPPEAKLLPDGSYQLPCSEEGVELYLRPSGAVEKVAASGQSSWDLPKGPIKVTYKFDGDDRLHVEEFDTVLLAIGRKALVDQLGLPEAGVELFEGKVLVDEAEQTTAPNIFAIGDCATGIKRHQVGEKRKTTVVAKERPELTPVAIQAGQLLARRLFGKGPLMNYNLVPTTVFTPDEYGFCGLSQEDAERPEKEGGIGAENVEVFVSRYGNLEISPTHPHMVELRSHHYTGFQQWAVQYCRRHNLDWPEATLDPAQHADVLLLDDKGGSPTRVKLLEKHTSDKGTIVYDVRMGEGDEAQVIKGLPIDKLRLLETDEQDRAELLIKANCLAKLVCDKRHNLRVVGFHFIGENAGEITQGFSLALHLGATKDHFDNLVGIHPTAAEEFTVLDNPLSSGKSFLKKAGCGGGSCG